RIGSLRPGNENPKAYRPAIMKLPMVTIGAHNSSRPIQRVFDSLDCTSRRENYSKRLLMDEIKAIFYAMI
ncbi:MAG: hypothetical protein ACK5N9_26015, partial [Pirellula sp.]